jgi:hypothetical protein
VITQHQARYVAAQVAASLLENAADVRHQDALLRAIRVWFPDVTQVDPHELKTVAEAVRHELLLTRASVMNRTDRWVAEGKATAV